MPETRVLRDGLAEVVSEHMAINDVMCAFQIVRELRCAECGATAKTTERQGMAAAREMYEAGWTATFVCQAEGQTTSRSAEIEANNERLQINWLDDGYTVDWHRCPA